MSMERIRDTTMMRYFNSEHGDISMMGKDVVFTIMATSQEHCGPAAVLGMLSLHTISEYGSAIHE